MALTRLGESGGDVLQMAGVTGIVNFRVPKKDTPAWRVVMAALGVLHRFDDRAAPILADKNLSAAGREAAIAPVRAGAADDLREQEIAIEVLRDAQDQRRAKLFEVPTIDPIDKAGDIETRSLFGSLDAGQRAAVGNAMAAGEDDALLAALMRTPIKLLIPAGVQQIWDARCNALNADTLSEIVSTGEDVLRGEVAIQECRNFLWRGTDVMAISAPMAA